jgi:hypothetical protein
MESLDDFLGELSKVVGTKKSPLFDPSKLFASGGMLSAIEHGSGSYPTSMTAGSRSSGSLPFVVIDESYEIEKVSRAEKAKTTMPKKATRKKEMPLFKKALPDLSAAVGEIPALAQLGKVGQTMYSHIVHIQRATIIELLKQKKTAVQSLEDLDEYLLNEEDHGTW